MAVDTSSAAAAHTPVVGPPATAGAALIAEPIPAKSVAAPVTRSGATNTNDIGHLPYPNARGQQTTGTSAGRRPISGHSKFPSPCVAAGGAVVAGVDAGPDDSRGEVAHTRRQQ